MEFSLYNPSLVIFDWDGTLVSTLPLLHKAHNYARESLGYPSWSMQEYKSHMHYSARELYPNLYAERADEAYKALYKYVDEHHIKELEVLAGAEGLLQFFDDRNIPMILVSNKTHRYLVKEVEHLGWQDYFKGIIGAGVAEKDKPETHPVNMIMQKRSIPTSLLENAIFVGDTGTDVKCAQNLGIPSIIIGDALNESETAVYENLEIFKKAFEEPVSLKKTS